MASLKSKLKASVSSGKINIFLLFLLLSFSILLLTKLSKDYVKTVAFDVKAINLPEDKVIISDSMHKINVTLKTYGFKLLRYYFSNPKLSVDLNNVQRVDNRFIWTSKNAFEAINSQFTSNVEVMNIQPDTMMFVYGTNEVRMIPVLLNHNIAYAPGYNITEDFIIVPDSIKVIGPKILIDSIKTIQTQELVLNNVSKSINETLNIITFPAIDIKTSTNKLTVTANVDKFTEGTVQVPITVVNQPENVTINYFPKHVNVLFYTSLSNYKDIKSKDFVVACDFNDLSDNASYLVPKIVTKPTKVKTAKINQNKIEFILSQ